jgi:hypothetical protein
LLKELPSPHSSFYAKNAPADNFAKALYFALRCAAFPARAIKEQRNTMSNEIKMHQKQAYLNAHKHSA